MFLFHFKRFEIKTQRRPKNADILFLLFIEKNPTDCVRQFEDARIFDGRTICEAESEIEVLFG